MGAQSGGWVPRRPSKTSGLMSLKARGLKIDAVIDVGVFEDTPELREAFPNSFHLLIEPLAHLVPTIERNYASITHKLITAACSDKRSEGHLQLDRHQGGGGEVTHSRLLPMAPPLDAVGDYQTIPILRVDQAVKEAGLTGRLLLKIDVDGHEMRVLRGAEGVLDQIDIVIIEVLPHEFMPRLNFMHDRGFKVADVVDIVHYDDMFWQMDVIFISQRLARDPAFRPDRGEKVDLTLFHQIG